VLVKEVNWLGDLVISLPALRAVRGAFPAARLSVLVKQELAGFFDGLRWVDEVIAYRIRPGVRGIRDRWRLVRSLAEAKYDLAIVFPKSFEAALWAALARVPERVGLATQGRAILLTRPAPRRNRGELGHQFHDYLDMLRDTLRFDDAGEDGRLEIGEKRRAAAADWLAERRRRPEVPLIALAAGAAYGPAKEWPAEYFVTLVDRLGARFECVLVGSPGERARAEEIAAKSRVGAIVAAGATDVGDLIALVSLAAGFVGNDSGAMHVAAALGVPTVGIFGSTSPVLTGPRGPRVRVVSHATPCSPCFDRRCRFGHYDCLTRIDVDAVIRALAALGVWRG
jgi:heptosyltransferase-2